MDFNGAAPGTTSSSRTGRCTSTRPTRGIRRSRRSPRPAGSPSLQGRDQRQRLVLRRAVAPASGRPGHGPGHRRDHERGVLAALIQNGWVTELDRTTARTSDANAASWAKSPFYDEGNKHTMAPIYSSTAGIWPGQPVRTTPWIPSWSSSCILVHRDGRRVPGGRRRRGQAGHQGQRGSPDTIAGRIRPFHSALTLRGQPGFRTAPRGRWRQLPL